MSPLFNQYIQLFILSQSSTIKRDRADLMNTKIPLLFFLLYFLNFLIILKIGGLCRDQRGCLNLQSTTNSSPKLSFLHRRAPRESFLSSSEIRCSNEDEAKLWRALRKKVLVARALPSGQNKTFGKKRISEFEFVVQIRSLV